MAVIIGTNLNDAGAKALVGDGAADFIDGKSGDDEIFGQSNNDFLIGGLGSDYIDGGSGQDTVSYLYSTSGIVVDLDSNKTWSAVGDVDELWDVELVWGSNQTDFLYGTDKSDTFLGWNGDDYLTGRGGGDTLSGGNGFDIAVYQSSSAGVVVNLATGDTSGGDAQGDKLTSIEGIDGSGFADTLIGNGAGNYLFGDNGKDILRGNGGADDLVGGKGKDQLWGNSGADHFEFRSGDSAATKADADVIKDFSEAQGDKIDLTAFGDLDFIGGDAFSAPDQARVTTSNGNTYVAINETGTGTAEMFIRLDGLHSLEQNDFIL